jgi:hypothetical protein
MSKFDNELSEYANLIEKIGKTRITQTQNLSEKLIINEVSYWDIFSAEMAWRHLTTASSIKSPWQLIKYLMKLRLIIFREWFKRFVIKRRFKGNFNKDIPPNSIIFLAFMPRMYIDVIYPLIMTIAKEEKINIVVLKDGTGQEGIFKELPGVIYRDIWSFWDKDLENESNNLKKVVKKVTQGLVSKIKNSEAKKYLINKHGKALELSLKSLLTSQLPLILEKVTISRNILSKYNPQLIISPDNSDARTRLYKIIGKKMGIPSLDIQFGLTGPSGVEWRFFIADKVAVWGESSKKELINHGINKEKIIITGSPRHDCILFPNKKSKEMLNKKYQIKREGPVVLFASTYTDKTHFMFSNPNVLNDMKKAIFDAAKKYSNITLLVKPHPVEKNNAYYNLGLNIKNIILVDKEEDMTPLIHISDYFISFGSTASIDALIAKKNSICPIFPGWPFSNFFEKSKVVHIPKSRKDVINLFSKIVDNSLDTIGNKYFLKKHVYKNDGMSSQRIKRLILDLI